MGNARERTRTSTPYWAQALNLLCIPIPPRGQLCSDYSLDGPNCQLGRDLGTRFETLPDFVRIENA